MNDDDEGPGPQRHVKLFLSPPQDGEICELPTCELVSPAGRIEVMYVGTTAKGNPMASLVPTIVLSGERKQVNLILHLLKFHGDTVLKFSGFRHDPRRSHGTGNLNTWDWQRSRRADTCRSVAAQGTPSKFARWGSGTAWVHRARWGRIQKPFVIRALLTLTPRRIRIILGSHTPWPRETPYSQRP